MPQYVYRCEDCKAELCLIQTIAEGEKYVAEGEFTCPSCGGKRGQRILGGTSFRLQGGGWFRDGYR